MQRRDSSNVVNFGIFMNDASCTFEKDPEDCLDFSETNFRARTKVIDQLADWREKKMQGKGVIYKNE